MNRLPVSVTHKFGAVTAVVKRFATIKEAESYLSTSAEVDPDAREAGEYGIDAPEEMINPPRRQMLLPSDPAERKGIPITTGVLDYFPLAMAYVARVSKAGNDQHNPGQPLHWDKTKSKDHADCIARHLIDRGTVDTTDGLLHSGKLAWRALALLETELGNGTEP